MKSIDQEDNRIKTILDAVNNILESLKRLDRVRNREEFNKNLIGLLEAVGRSTNSDRSYLFEWNSSKKESFRYVQEWCAEGVHPTMDMVPLIDVRRIPNWIEQLQKAEAIVSEDWYQDRQRYPEEFEAFEGQNINNLIVIPIFVKGKLNGFFGLDNPEKGLSDLILQMLTSVAGHLGSVKENFYMLDQLKRKEERLTESLQEIDFEKHLLNALSIDYTVVYFCDLVEDYVVPVKVGKKIDIGDTEVNWWRKVLCEKSDSYVSRMQYYFDNHVIKESAPDFLEKLEAKRVMQVLEQKERMLYRFCTKPNVHGQQHFEVQFVRLPDLEGFKVVMGIRYIDDLVAEEERQHIFLEKALADANLKNEIVGSISKIYLMIYRVDLNTELYEEIASEEEIHHLTGVTGKAKDAYEKMIDTIIAPKSREEMQKFLDLSTLAERLKDTETIATDYPTTNGSWHIARFIVKKRDKNGRVTNVLYLVREVSKEKQQEMEYEKRLAAMAIEAQRANIAKTDFLRRMSHDIRTPLNGMRGILSVAERYPNDLEKLQRCREKVMETSGYLLELVNHVLDMNKLESGAIVLEHKPFNLFEVFQTSNNLIEMQGQMKGVSLFVNNYGISHPHLLGSPTHVKQILQNIVGNAVKYTNAGGTVTVSCTEISCENGKAMFQLTCTDTGIGMSEAFLTQAFEPFAQEKSNARTNYMGTGLGLSIVKQLIDLMGGSISVESEEHVGSTFTFYLPFDVDQNYKEETNQVKAEAEQSLQGVHVLLVEDNDLNMEIAKVLLEDEGMRVSLAWNGREAVEKFEQSDPYQYDVILMDIMMPELDGLEASRKIRSLDREDAACVPILAMTANAFFEDAQRSKEAGMNEHLVKPLEIDELLSAIKRNISR